MQHRQSDERASLARDLRRARSAGSASGPRQLVRIPVTAADFKAFTQRPNFGNDYNGQYHHTGVLPQAHIRNIEDPYAGYPKLQELHHRKEEHTRAHIGIPVGHQCDPQAMPGLLSDWASEGVNFDVVMVGGCVPTFDPAFLMSLPMANILPRPSVLFLWTPSCKLNEAREVLEYWGLRRSEDIVYMVNSVNSVHMPPTDASQVFRSTTWHCLMGLKGTLRRSDDNNLINCNVDTDVIVEKPHARPNIVPAEIYSIIENFILMGRRLHIVPTFAPEALPVRVRPGWVTLSPDVLISNFSPRSYKNRMLVPINPQIEQLRPKTPPGNKGRHAK